MTKFINSEFLRYLIVGGTNTAISFLIYQVLRLLIPYQVAYTIAYLCGIPISYFLNSRFVFHQPLHWKKALQFPLTYVAQYFVGIALLSVWVEVLHISEVIAPLLVVICTVPVTFVISRLIIKGRNPHPAQSST